MARYTESIQGRQRERNEDHAYSFKLDDLYGLVVADGLGGHAAGDVASELAARTFGDSIRRLHSGALDAEAVRLSFEDADEALHREMATDADTDGMGSTLVTATTAGSRALVGNVGDSRAYLVRDGGIEQVSTDHTETSYYGMAGHRRSSTYLTNVVGGWEQGVQVDISEVELAADDVLLLCTDGLTDELDDSRISHIVSRADSVSEAGRNLVDYANRNGGRDNITVALYSPS
ncbi:PP2C family protein-serine/threonine phosphatase [Haloarcula sediminis]|uniref:PP2C family protein-serine/threonine phosphatase n=1 Tax=Haloarcula sediminis TaxID=3111777 RepID=UPI002D779936|nr:protein phosphatase 2C domain-containing protein [Haloarcula sp. CK38]